MRSLFGKPLSLLAMAACVTGCQTTDSHKPFRLDSALGRTQSPADELQQFSQVEKKESWLKVPNFFRSDPHAIDPKVARASDPTNLQYDPGPLQPSLYLSAARMMEQQGQLDEAFSQYQIVLKSEPENREALIGVARLHHRRGDLNAAIASYQQLLSKLPADPVVMNDLGLCLARAGKSDDAIALLRRVVQMSPENLMYRNNLAAVLVEADRSQEAVEMLAQSHGFAVANYNVGYMLNQRGTHEAAQTHFVRALQADPQFEPARTMLNQGGPVIGRRPAPIKPKPGALPSNQLIQTSQPRQDETADLTDAVQPVSYDAPVTSGAATNSTDTEPAKISPASAAPDESEAKPDLTKLPGIRLPEARTPRARKAGWIAPTPDAR